MTAQLGADDGAAPDDGRPNLSGDLPTVFQAAPMFRRTAVGYDRFQVDTYVRWAEDELATAERERDHLLTRHVATQAALDEARRLLSHSAGGAEVLRVSGRIGAVLAAAADEAEDLRTEAQAEVAAAAAEAQRLTALAEQALADAGAEAQRLVAEAAGEADALTAEAGRVVAAAERTLAAASTEAAARLAEVAVAERRAVEQAEQLRRQALADGAAARENARHEVVAMLATGRAERRRADAAAAEVRERLDREATSRRAVLLAQVESLEARRAALVTQLALLSGPTAAPTGRRLDLHLRGLRTWLGWPPRSVRVP